jgi:hypothetical protein
MGSDDMLSKWKQDREEQIKVKAVSYARVSVFPAHHWEEFIEVMIAHNPNILPTQIDTIAATIMTSGINIHDYMNAIAQLH